MGVESSISANYRSDRDANVQLREEDLKLLQQLWVDHGEQGVDAFLHQHFDRRYYEGWHFQSIDSISWTTTTNYGDLGEDYT